MDKDLEQEENDASEAEAPEEERSDVDVAELLMKIQQHLIYLEKKIDSLLTQASEKPAFKKDFSSRPPRPFGRSNWSGSGGGGGGGAGAKRYHHGEKRGGFGGRERPFGDRGDRGNRGDRPDRGPSSERGPSNDRGPSPERGAERGDRGGFRGGGGGGGGGGFRKKRKSFE